MTSSFHAQLRVEFETHRKTLWRLCYRMTGVPADADDLMQETLARALEKPPSHLDAPLRPWLTRVAVNLATDFLRRRRRHPYHGTWLPGVCETDEDLDFSVEAPSTEGRYDLVESASLAFLVALEVLTPKQRAVLLLREVFEESVEAVAALLAMTEANVKVTHHRARKALESYRQSHRGATPALRQQTSQSLQDFLGKLSAGDISGAEAMLANSVQHFSDGGDEFYAAKVPLVGPKRVVQFLVRLTQLRGLPDAFHVRSLNGLPALVASYAKERCRPKEAPRFVMQVTLNGDGKISEIYNVLASRKLAALKGSGDTP